MDTNQTSNRSCDSLCAALRLLCDASYAILPRDVAHRLGDFQKNCWGAIGWFADKNIDWIEQAVAGGDRLREEWQQRRAARPSHVTDQPPDAA
ncbi:MAG: hypothetical protein DMF64_06490 [Acidobacteria bacterium]|nr:MAG: hypothetical protein DMF64_06490 [Acidobacteriota bacterium]